MKKVQQTCRYLKVCPNGTIPATRIPMWNLFSAPSLDKFGKKYPDGYTKELHEYIWVYTYSSYQDSTCRTSWRHPQDDISSKSTHASRERKEGISSNSSASRHSEIPINSAHPLQVYLSPLSPCLFILWGSFSDVLYLKKKKKHLIISNLM